MGYLATRAQGLKFGVLDKDGKPTGKTKVYASGEKIPDKEIERLSYGALVAHLSLNWITWEGKDGEVAPHNAHKGGRNNVVLMREYIQGGKDRSNLNAEILAKDKAKKTARETERFSRHPVESTSKLGSGAPEPTHTSAGKAQGDAKPPVALIPCDACEQAFKTKAGLSSHVRKKHAGPVDVAEPQASEPQQAG